MYSFIFSLSWEDCDCHEIKFLHWKLDVWIFVSESTFQLPQFLLWPRSSLTLWNYFVLNWFLILNFSHLVTSLSFLIVLILFFRNSLYLPTLTPTLVTVPKTLRSTVDIPDMGQTCKINTWLKARPICLTVTNLIFLMHKMRTILPTESQWWLNMVMWVEQLASSVLSIWQGPIFASSAYHWLLYFLIFLV
jgi:hypothetical protein